MRVKLPVPRWLADRWKAVGDVYWKAATSPLRWRVYIFAAARGTTNIDEVVEHLTASGVAEKFKSDRSLRGTLMQMLHDMEADRLVRVDWTAMPIKIQAARRHLAIVEIGHVFIDYPFHVTMIALGFALLLVSYRPYNPLAFWISLGWILAWIYAYTTLRLKTVR